MDRLGFGKGGPPSMAKRRPAAPKDGKAPYQDLAAQVGNLPLFDSVEMLADGGGTADLKPKRAKLTVYVDGTDLQLLEVERARRRTVLGRVQGVGDFSALIREAIRKAYGNPR